LPGIFLNVPKSGAYVYRRKAKARRLVEERGIKKMDDLLLGTGQSSLRLVIRLTHDISRLNHCKTQYRKFETNIPKKAIAWAAGKCVNRSWENINGSQTHTANVDVGTRAAQFPF